MIRRYVRSTTRFVFSRFTARWTIRQYKEFVSRMENGFCIGSRAMDMQINDAKCCIKVYPHGKSEDDKDSITVDVDFKDDTFMLLGKIKITLSDSNEVPIREMEKDVLVAGVDSVTFEKIVESNDTIDDLIVTCEMYGDFRVDECEEFDFTEDENELNGSNVVSPLR